MERDLFLRKYRIEQEDFNAAGVSWEELTAIADHYATIEGKLREIGKDFVDKYSELLENMKESINQTFWNEEKHLYATYKTDGELFHYGELTQALALYNQICDGEKSEHLCNALINNEEIIPITLSYSVFKYESILKHNKKYAKYVFDDIAAHGQLDALGKCPERLARKRTRVGDGDGLSAAHRGYKLLMQNLNVGLIQRSIHFCSPISHCGRAVSPPLVTRFSLHPLYRKCGYNAMDFPRFTHKKAISGRIPPF